MSFPAIIPTSLVKWSIAQHFKQSDLGAMVHYTKLPDVFGKDIDSLVKHVKRHFNDFCVKPLLLIITDGVATNQFRYILKNATTAVPVNNKIFNFTGIPSDIQKIIMGFICQTDAAQERYLNVVEELRCKQRFDKERIRLEYEAEMAWMGDAECCPW